MNKSTLTEVFLSGEQREDDGSIWAEILREGEFATTPLGNGTVNKPFKVVANGPSNSDPDNLVVSMEELINNFNDKAFEYVTIPLSHDDLLLENTGFIEELKMEQGEDGLARLWAKHRFTEPDIETKIKRGSIPSRSAGIFFNFVRKADGKEFIAALKHVTPTDTPWIDGLNPYGVFASDEDKPDSVSAVSVESPKVEDHKIVEPETKEVPAFDAKGWLQTMVGKAKSALVNQFNNGDYEVVGVGLDNVVVSNTEDKSWTVSYGVQDNGNLILASVNDWQLVSGKTKEPSMATAQLSDEATPLREAQHLRELRLSHKNGSNKGGKSQMAKVNRLEELDLSDEAREAVQSLMAENKSLQDEKRKSHINERIQELKGLGLDKHPGFLKEVQAIYMSDDGGPALVLKLSDENGKLTGEVEQTATDIVDRLIAVLPRDDEQKIVLSDQHNSGDGTHIHPDADDQPSHDEKVSDWKSKLYPETNRRKSSGGER